MRSHFLSALLLAFVLSVAGRAAGSELPAGTHLAVRLDTRLSTRRSHVGDPIEATLIAPVRIGAAVALPAGPRVRGRVVEVGCVKERHRRTLRVLFSQLLLPSAEVPIRAQFAEIDNARETVDAAGGIVGPARPRLRPGLLEVTLLLAASNPALAGIYELGRLFGRSARGNGIDYRPGVEATLELLAPVTLSDVRGAEEGESSADLQALARDLPTRTLTRGATHLADVTNLLLLGDREDLVRAFADAGWSRADPVDVRAEMRIFWALAGRRAYRAAPVSRLELYGRAPDLVFEKQTNTITKRHHVRIWDTGEEWEGRAVFLAAGSRDVSLFFSRSGRRVTHHIDPDVDRERAKIVDDLAFARPRAVTALLERPSLSELLENAAGDPIRTDGQMGVVILEKPPAKGGVEIGAGPQ